MSIAKIRLQITDVPDTPRSCYVLKDCVYRERLLVCDDPRCNKQNGDAACHKMSNKELIGKLAMPS